ncbi:hypothetical protein GCM10029976_057420 [Kribbella albertanoniae]|uniref:Uncharacterized protein n=1 Tax=Kribbella albertanoniae TaxID=1266829 RepID=A0A4R4P6Z6_9ACTN|nr:hypothetical protein [Kribbella albertanoniae]TDC16623.1 hypothetical protein E1261_38550 [Kribbella albertanoniae]
MFLTSGNIQQEFLTTFPQAAAALEADAGTDPAGRVDWVFRHDVMPNAIGDPAALRDVFAWIERLLQSTDNLIEYWTGIRLIDRTLDSTEWEPLVEEYAGPLLATVMSR